LLPLGEAVPRSAITEVYVDRLRWPPFDGGDVLRQARQWAISQLRHKRLVCPAGRGLACPDAQQRSAHESAVRDALFKGGDPADGLIARWPVPRIRRVDTSDSGRHTVQSTPLTT
jgi:hypothetical protein